MRRLLALLALASLTWSNVAALHCGGREGAAHSSEAQSARTHSEHSRHGSHAPSGGHDHDATDHEGCTMPWACGAAMIRPLASRATLRMPAPCAPGAEQLPGPHSATPEAADPPPPRRFA